MGSTVGLWLRLQTWGHSNLVLLATRVMKLNGDQREDKNDLLLAGSSSAALCPGVRGAGLQAPRPCACGGSRARGSGGAGMAEGRAEASEPANPLWDQRSRRGLLQAVSWWRLLGVTAGGNLSLLQLVSGL